MGRSGGILLLGCLEMKVLLWLIGRLLGVNELLFLLGGGVFVEVADHVDGERGDQRLGLACVDGGANAGGLGLGLLLRA